MAFLLKILRIFIMAAFSTSPDESSVYDAATLVRRSSSSGAETLIETKTQALNLDTEQATEGSRFRSSKNSWRDLWEFTSSSRLITKPWFREY
jgi:hypothetical protein